MRTFSRYNLFAINFAAQNTMPVYSHRSCSIHTYATDASISFKSLGSRRSLGAGRPPCPCSTITLCAGTFSLVSFQFSPLLVPNRLTLLTPLNPAPCPNFQFKPFSSYSPSPVFSNSLFTLYFPVIRFRTRPGGRSCSRFVRPPVLTSSLQPAEEGAEMGEGAAPSSSRMGAVAGGRCGVSSDSIVNVLDERARLYT